MQDSRSKSGSSFVDTNVWLYAFIESVDKQKSAVASKLIKEFEIIISTQVINDVCINLLRQAQFPEDKIRQLIRSFYARYTVVEIGQAVLLKASELRERYHFSFWDGLIVCSALYGGARLLYSEDMQDGLLVENHLSIINPFKSIAIP